MSSQQNKKIMTDHKIKCRKCGKFKTFPNFPFSGKGKKKRGVPGAYRKDKCLACGGKSSRGNVYDG